MAKTNTKLDFAFVLPYNTKMNKGLIVTKKIYEFGFRGLKNPSREAINTTQVTSVRSFLTFCCVSRSEVFAKNVSAFAENI
jgi:hypothetical protein